MKNSPVPPMRPVALAVGLSLSFSLLPAFADTLQQTVDEASQGSLSWNSAVWGSPAAAPTAGNTYFTTVSVRSIQQTAAQSFAGGQLRIDPGGRLLLKHNTGVATANLVLNGGLIAYNQGPGGNNCPLAGTLQVPVDSSIVSLVNVNTRDIWLQSTLSGSGNLEVNMGNRTNALVLQGNNSAYTGNWTVDGGRLEIGNGAVSPLGSGTVTLSYSTNYLAVNATNDYVINNTITGAGYFSKLGSGTVTLAGNNTFTGGLTNQDGTLVLTGSGTQSTTVAAGNGVLRVANNAAIPSGSTLVVTVNNAQTGRLELANGVTIATGNFFNLQRRTGPTVAVEAVSGDNAINDLIVIQGGGISPAPIQADAGATLTLAGGITSGVTGNRDILFQGAGNGTINGSIDNGVATWVAVYKDGPGTWTLNAPTYYTGVTGITNGVLKLGPGGTLGSTPVINLVSGATLDVADAPGAAYLNGQILAGSGTVLGDFLTYPGSYIQVGFTNQYGPLTFGNNLNLSGGETLQYDLSSTTNDVLNVGGSLTLSGSTIIEVTLPGGFVNSGTYRLINYTGTIQGGGSFILNAPATSQTFTLDTSTPGQVNLVVSGTAGNLVWAGDNSGNVWDVGTTPNWTGTANVFYNGDNATFNDSGSASPAINVTTPVTPAAMTINSSANNYTFTGSPITSPGNLVKQGSSTATFTAAGNSFGAVSIQGGALSIGDGSDGSLDANSITNNGTLVFNRNASGAITMHAAISGPGSIRLAASAGGDMVNFTASNSYTGLTIIETNSVFSIMNNNALGDPSVGTVVQAGGRLGFTSGGNWVVPEAITINGFGYAGTPGALYANTANNNVLWTGPITVGSESQIRIVNSGVKMAFANTVIGDQTPLLLSQQDAGSSMIFSNTLAIGNAAALTKDGAGTLILAGATNIAGSTLMSTGVLQVLTTNTPRLGDVTITSGNLILGSGAADGSLPDGAINLVGSSSRLVFDSSNTFVMNKPLLGAGGVNLTNYARWNIYSSNAFTGTVTTGNGTPTVGGYIGLFNSYGLGDGTVGKSVSLTHASLELQGNLDIPPAVSFLISGGAQSVDIAGGLIPFRNMSGSNVVEGNITLNSGAGDAVVTSDSGTLVLNGAITANSTGRNLVLDGAGNGILNGAFTNNGANLPGLAKQGSGTWTITHEADYSGNTVIRGGTLVLNGPIPNTPTIQLLSNAVLNASAIPGGLTLGSSQTLSGNGTVIGDVASIGTVTPGASIGTLNFANNLFLFGTTVLELNRTNAQNSDRIAAANVTFGGILTITNAGDALQAGDTFNLFDGNLSGSFSVTNLPALGAPELSWDLSQFQSQGIIKVAGPGGTPASPTILPPAVSGGNLVLQVNSDSGFNYILESTPQLAPANWTPVQTNAGGGTLTFSIPVNTIGQQGFFRIRVQ